MLKRVLLSSMFFVAAAAVAGQPPLRVVSLNLCTDQLLIALAEPQQIAAVSLLADEPMMSNYVAKAKTYPAVGNNAEQIVAYSPDLILASNYTDAVLSAWLKKFGYRLVALPLVNTLDEVPLRIEEIATLLQRPDQGRQLIDDYNHRMTQISQSLPPLKVIVVAANLYVAGAGTIPDQLLTRMGLVNVASAKITNGWAYITLEQLIAWQPDYIILQKDSMNRASRAEQVFDHAALKVLLQDSQRINVPAKYWICAGPEIAHAGELIQRQIQQSYTRNKIREK